MDICKNIKELIIPLVTDSDIVSVEYNKTELNAVSIVIRVGYDDVRKVVGNSGRVFRSIRTIIQAALNDYNIQITVDAIPASS